MSDDVRAAAERLMNPYAYDNEPFADMPFSDDARSVATAYLAEHPEDEDLGINAGWLQTALPVTRTVAMNDCVSYLIDCKFEIEHYMGRRWVAVIGAFIIELKTRRDAIRLCRGLKLTLKETSQP